jgi:DNA polymerase
MITRIAPCIRAREWLPFSLNGFSPMVTRPNFFKLERIEQEAHALRSIFPTLSKNYVPGEGDNVVAFIVGEAPGATEDVMRRPFVGKCAVLRELMDLAGLWATDSKCDPSKPANAWLTNVVKFRPPGNRNPSNAEVLAFRKLLQEEWHAVGEPRLIIPVGGIALSAIFDKPMPILKAAGRCHKVLSAYKGKSLHIWPMLHPAFGLRGGPELQKLIEQDWERLGKWREKFGE